MTRPASPATSTHDGGRNWAAALSPLDGTSSVHTSRCGWQLGVQGVFCGWHDGFCCACADCTATRLTTVGAT